MKTGGWYYKDRLGRTRGPMELIQLKTAWGGGIIDKDTFIWGDDMDEWAPIHMIYGMERAIATWEVRLGVVATAFLHKLQKGIPPWVPLKGREQKTCKQMRQEAIESKKCDLAVLEANGGILPGVKIPSHALFLLASGPELTKYFGTGSYAKHIHSKRSQASVGKNYPWLKAPWEVLSVEQAMDQITYGGQWYCEPLGSYMTGSPYIRHWNEDVKGEATHREVYFQGETTHRKAGRLWAPQPEHFTEGENCETENRRIFPTGHRSHTEIIKITTSLGYKEVPQRGATCLLSIALY